MKSVVLFAVSTMITISALGIQDSPCEDHEKDPASGICRPVQEAATPASTLKLEAQFIGVLVSKEKREYDQGKADCYLRVSNFSHFGGNISSSAIENSEIIDFDCQRNEEVGSKISGVIVQDEAGRLIIEP